MFKIFDLLNGSLITRKYVEQALVHGVAALHVTINNFSTIRPYPTLPEALSELAAIRAHFAGLEDVVKMVGRYSDFAAAAAANKLAVVLGYQNVPGIGQQLGILELFRDLGVSVIQIAHNNRGPYADGCAEPANAGLSALGRELILELNRLGIVIDVSHTGDASSIEAIRLSSRPVCVTHANAFAVCANPRNKSDAVLAALKDNGGVIGLCYLTPLVRGGGVKPTHADLLSHFIYVRDRIGAAHIGIGSDFITGQPAERYQEFMRKPDVYGTWPWIFPIEDLEDQQRFLASLGQNGFTPADIQGIARDNFLRVFERILQ